MQDPQFHKRTANPSMTLPASAARLKPALGTNDIVAALPVLPGVLEEVAWEPPKPETGGRLVLERVALAVEMVAMEVLPR